MKTNLMELWIRKSAGSQILHVQKPPGRMVTRTLATGDHVVCLLKPTLFTKKKQQPPFILKNYIPITLMSSVLGFGGRFSQEHGLLCSSLLISCPNYYPKLEHLRKFVKECIHILHPNKHPAIFQPLPEVKRTAVDRLPHTALMLSCSSEVPQVPRSHGLGV